MGDRRSFSPNGNSRLPRVLDMRPDAPAMRCVHCACPDLRVGGNGKITYIACPHCGADGPMMSSRSFGDRVVDAAINNYDATFRRRYNET